MQKNKPKKTKQKQCIFRYVCHWKFVQLWIGTFPLVDKISRNKDVKINQPKNKQRKTKQQKTKQNKQTKTKKQINPQNKQTNKNKNKKQTNSQIV